MNVSTNYTLWMRLYVGEWVMLVVVVDIDECAPGGIASSCNTTVGVCEGHLPDRKFRCTCHTGYELQADNFTCIGLHLWAACLSVCLDPCFYWNNPLQSYRHGIQIGNTLHSDTIHECNTTLSRSVVIVHNLTKTVIIQCNASKVTIKMTACISLTKHTPK